MGEDLRRLTWPEYLDRVMAVINGVRDLHPEDQEKVLFAARDSVTAAAVQAGQFGPSFEFWRDQVLKALGDARKAATQ